MQQDNLRNKLQQLENQSLPDLSEMDAHWQQMETSLAKSPDKKHGIGGRTISLFIAAAVVIVVLLLTIKNLQPEKKPSTATQMEDTTRVEQPIKLPLRKTVVQREQKQQSNQPIDVVMSQMPVLHNPSPDTNVTINFYPCDTCAKITTTNFPDSFHEAFLKMLAQKEMASNLLMSNFYDELQKPAQEFTIDNRFDTTLICNEGTVLKIPAAAFEKTTEKISIEVKEYYSYADMVLNKLNTTSDDKQLISDGMISVKAMQNGKEIELRGMNTIGLQMPRRDLDNNMQLFTGEIIPINAEAKKINWVAQGQYQQNMPNEKSPDKTWEPYSVKKRWLSNKEVRKYIMQKDSMTKVEATQLIRKESPKEDFIIKIKKHLTFRKILGKNDFYRHNGVPNWVFKNGVNSEEGKTFDKLSLKYSFNLKNTGWINCDRFYNDPAPKIQFFVSDSSKTKIYLSYLVFDDIRSVMTNYGIGYQSFFYNIPEGKKATLICLGIKNGKTVYAMKKIVAEKKSITDIKFEETTPAEFRKQIAGLDL